MYTEGEVRRLMRLECARCGGSDPGHVYHCYWAPSYAGPYCDICWRLERSEREGRHEHAIACHIFARRLSVGGIYVAWVRGESTSVKVLALEPHGARCVEVATGRELVATVATHWLT